MQSPGLGSEVVYVAIVDDDASVSRSLGRLLRAAGFQTVSYPSAEAFLQDAKRPRFDCLVLDVQLQGISGLELSRRLAEVKDTTPVLFLTTHDRPETRAEALDTGCAGYFRKTDPGEHILQALRNALSQRNGTSAHPR